ncbi:excinuclease ABC subunit A, partial [mine drainage metagenome]
MRQKHSIEAVVDRFRPRPELKQRLAESFETALRLGEGLALVIDMDAGQESPSAAGGSALPTIAGRAGALDARAAPQVFSSRYSCPVCDYSLPELEPRLFSFNSPLGACPRCDGLGTTEFFDPARIVLHGELSLAGGAVRGWDRRNP